MNLHHHSTISFIESSLPGHHYHHQNKRHPHHGSLLSHHLHHYNDNRYYLFSTIMPSTSLNIVPSYTHNHRNQSTTIITIILIEWTFSQYRVEFVKFLKRPDEKQEYVIQWQTVSVRFFVFICLAVKKRISWSCLKMYCNLISHLLTSILGYVL